jgi:hypothetical protein
MKLAERFWNVDPAWRTALVAFLIARLALTGWSLLLFLLFPTIVQNLDLFGSPVLAAFDLASSERYAYARQIDATTLSFRPAGRGYVTDVETGSIWSLAGKQAIAGKYTGSSFQASTYTVEDVFPYRGVGAPSNVLLSAWQRFDTNWYLKIAEQGYASNDGSTVFFPLYPLLIRVLGTVLLQNDLFVALVISNLAAIGVFYFADKIALQLANRRVAARTVLFLAIFPSSFFLFAGYTESLFLLLALASLYTGGQSRWGVAGILGALAALTKLQGALLIIPLGFLWWRQVRSPASESSRTFSERIRVAPLALIPMATGAFLLWQYWFVERASLLTSYEGSLYAQFVWPWENVRAALSLLLAGRASAIDILNLLATVLFVVMAVLVWIRLPREYGLYTVAMLAAPLFRMTTTQPLVSMLRYVLVLFPVYILWGMWGKNPWVNRVVVYLSFPLALYASAQFVLWGWVG